MADIRLAKPVAGTTQTVPSAPDGRFIFDFPADAATLTRNGDDLVLSFEDGSSIRLQGFYTTYSKEDMPSFQVEGVEISGQDFFAALGEDLMPAAGPAAGSSASRGGRYNEYGGSDLLDGIDHLGRLDIGFGDGVEWADDQVGGWTHQNLDPEISGIIAVDGNDMTLVESGVETDEGQEIQGNVFTPGVPVVVGQVMASDPDGGRLSYSFADGSNRIVTEYGVITIDADTGVITYTLNNDDPDADSLALGETVRQDFTVRVEDGQGGKAEASFSVTIKGTNDQPEVTLDADSELKLTESGVGRIDSDTVVDAPGTEEENREYNGSHYDPGRNEQQLEGKVTGADVDAGHKLWFGAVAGDKSQDGSWEGAQSPDADIFLGKDATDGDVESSEPVEGSFGHLVLNSDGTWTYTLKGEQVALPEGTTVTLDGDEPISIKYIDELPEDAEVTDTFTIYVKDEHGAWNLETVTITITGTNDKPALEVGEQQGLVYESGVGRNPVTDAPIDDPAGSLAGENVEYDNTERETNTTTGTISASDVDRGDTLHFAVSKKGEATEIPQDSLTDTDRPVTARGNYGTLEVKETGNGEATYTYTLNTDSDTIPLSAPVIINGKTYDDLEALKAALGFEGDELTLNNLPEGAEVKDTFTIFVQDDKGAWVSKDVTITITGTNDQPTVELDDDKSELHLFESGVGRDNTTNEVVDVPEEENTPYNGSKQLTGKVTGHDVDAGDKLYFGVVHGDTDDVPANSIFLSKESTDTSVESSDPVSGIFGTLTLSSDGTWIYTLKDEQVELPEGTTVTLDGKTFDIGSINALPEGAEVTDTFTIYVKDEHGAWNLETVTITITGTNDKPMLTLKDAEGNAVSADEPLVTEESEPAKDDPETTWSEVEGKFEVADVDADAGLNQTIRIEGGTYPAEGEETTGTSSEGHISNGTGTPAIFTTDYGTLTVNPDGTWAYEVNGDSPKVQELDPHNPHYETFEITVVDEHGAYDTQTIVIKLDGESAYPVIDSYENLVFKEEGVYNHDGDGNTPTRESETVVDGDGNVHKEHHSATKLEGEVTATDVDISDKEDGALTFLVKAKDATLTTDGEPAASQPNTPQPGTPTTDGTTVYESDYGTLTFNKDGSYTYELKSGDDNAVNKLAQGQVLTETFTVTVTDTFGNSVSQDITITIHGTNDKPRLELGGGSDDDGSLHVTESGVGRHEDGTVVDGPDDELVSGPSKEGTATDEIDDYDDALTDTGNAAGSDADNNAHLVYGAAKGEAAGATLPEDFATTDAPVTVEGLYGTLTIHADGNYSYKLDEERTFTDEGDGKEYTINNLNEGDTLEETFTIFVKDEHGAWASKEVTVTVTGTNDRPELSVLEETFMDADGQVVADADSLRAPGTDSENVAVVELHGRVQATDADRENGAGAATTSTENHGLEFSLQKEGYSGESPSSEWTDSNGKTHVGDVGVKDIGDGTWTATTPYGTLTLDQYGNYTYELHDGGDDVTALGKGETVTETFVVRVVDDRGAWREETITITIKGTNDKPVIEEGSSSTLTVHEEGVWGDKTDTPEGKDPDDKFTGNNTLEATVSFNKQDAHDTHSLVIEGELPEGKSLKVTDNGEQVSDATYSITANADGTYTLTATIPGVNNGNPITLGKLTLQQGGEDGTLTYTFTPNQDGLNGLPQDMDLSVDIPLKVEDEHGSLSDTTHTATINIHGTNDRPTIAFGPEANEHVYADGVGREDGGTAVKTTDKNTLNPEENKGYESREVTGQLTADDADAGDDSFSFFVEDVTKGKGNIPLECTVNGDNTVTLTLNGGEVAKLELNPTTGQYTLKLLEGARDALKEYGEDAKFSFTVTFNVRDEHGSTAETSVKQTFTIHGTNDAPVISEAKRLELEEGGEDKSEKVEATDPDTKGPGTKLTYGLLDQDAYDKLTGEDSASVKMQDRIDTDYGFLEIDAKGEYTFHLDNDSEAVISLEEGQEETLTFHVAVRDDKGAWDVQEITVTITGKDTATVFTGDAAVVTVVEKGFGHYNNPVDFPGGPDRGEPSFASGRLEAKDFDTDADGNPHEVEFTIKTKEGETEPEPKAFSELPDDIRTAIKGQFPDGEDGDKSAWADDADIQILKGTYGTLYLNTATGQYFYQLDNADSDTQGLKLGEIQYDDFTIHAQGPGNGEDKGADQPLKVAVQGSNDAPKITGVTLDTASKEDGLEVAEDGFTITGLKEDGTVTEVKGSVVAKDVDSPDGSVTTEGNVLKYLIKVVDGDKVSYLGAWDNGLGYLKLDENTGDYTFVFYNDKFQYLKEGQPEDVTFTVVAVDEHNAVSEERELTFTITGKDDAPVITGSSDSITEDDSGTADLSATISDDDNGATPEITGVAGKDGEIVPLTDSGPWIIEGEYGTLTVTRTSEGKLEYTYKLYTETEDEDSYRERQELNVDSPSLKEKFIVHGQSGDKDAQGTITVTITGVNDAPTLTLKDADGNDLGTEPITVDGWNPVKGEAHGEDVDNIWEPDVESELRYSVSKGEDTGGEPGEPGEEQASSLQTIKGEFGYLTINSVTGEYTYVVDPFSEKYMGLGEDQSGKETFTIWVKDPHGAYAKREIVFDVPKVEGAGSGEPIELQPPKDIPDVIEDNNNYDVTLPPSVESDFERLLDVNGNPVEVPADQIWLLDNDGKPGSVTGNKTHVVETDYGSLILEKNENGEWGYRFVLNNSSEAVQELTEKDEIDLKFWVGTEEGKEVPINVTITGINDRPVIEAVTDLTVKDTDDGVSGQIETSDRDEGDVGNTEDGAPNLSYEITANGESVILTRDDGGTGYGPGTYMVKKDGEVLGKFTLKEDGSYSFTPDEGIAADLPAGDSKGFDLTITVKDDSGQENDSASDTIHITIEGTNEAPEIVDAPSLEVKEDVTLTNGQQLVVSDDRGTGSDNLSYSVAAGDVTGEGKPMAAGEYGTLFIDANGTYHYQLNNQLPAVQQLGEGASLTDTFTIFVKDKDGETVPTTVTVNIKGTNDDPVLSLSDPVLTIKEGTDGSVTGNALATDVDTGDTRTYSLKATSDGTVSEADGEYVYKTTYGTFYLDKTTGEYRFVLDNDAEAVKNLRPTDVVEDKVTVVVTDGYGGTSEKELTVHIKGTDSKPEVTAPESLEIDVPRRRGAKSRPTAGIAGQRLTPRMIPCTIPPWEPNP